jgi:C-terminal processing protease CtpA/Prc
MIIRWHVDWVNTNGFIHSLSWAAMNDIQYRMGVSNLYHWLIAFLLLICLCGSAVARLVDSQSRSREVFTPAELNSDLDTMMRTLEEVHPDLYQRTSRAEIAAARRELEASLTSPLTQREFYLFVARLVARFNDGHTNVVQAPEAWRSFLIGGGLVFPFDLKYSVAGLKVARNYSDEPGITAGDVVVSINDSNAKDLFGLFLKEVSGEKPAYRISVVELLLGRFLWFHGVTDPYTIRYRSHSTGRLKTLTIRGLTNQVRVERQRQANPQTVGYRYEVLPGGVGYLEFRAMSGTPPAFRTFLEDVFKQIRDSHTSGLIVDLRKNSGGESAVGEELLSFITDKPYKTADRKEWKVSKPYKEFLGRAELGRQGKEYLNAAEGSVLIYRANLTKPRENPLRFNGPVCFLIGPGTFSSAVMLANAVGDFKLATLIGEETGGVPNEFGETYDFRLPNSGIVVTVSSAVWVRANGDANDRRGVMPDIPSKRTARDLERGVDTVLEFARLWVRQQQ